MKLPWLCGHSRPASRSAKSVKRAPRLRPAIESLESRELPASTIFVVPLNQAVDVKHRHSLAEAMTFAGTTGTVVIEPGATADVGAVDVTYSQLTIKGDDNVPGSILPRYDLNIKASQVTLTNLNLGTVTVAATANNLLLSRSQLKDFTETGAVDGVGHNILSQNNISGAVDLQGNVSFNVKTSDLVEHNTFSGKSGIMLKLTNSKSSEIRDNTFYGDGAGQEAIQVRSNSDHVTIANNRVYLTGASTPTCLVLTNTGGALGNLLGASVIDNVFSSAGQGRGISMNIFVDGSSYGVRAEGNDFRGNLVGVELNGVSGNFGAGFVTLGGDLFGITSSNGGNDFRGFNGANGHYAVYLHNTDMGSAINAQNNIFDIEVNASSVVRDGANGGGTGSVEVSGALNGDRAFVQNLYNKVLGRAGDPAAGSELDWWVAQLPSIGRGGVVHNILYSSESLNRIVDHFYRIYLGRDSGASERAGWVAALQGGMSIDQVEAGFITSPEFLSHIHTEFVQALYLNILRRPGTTPELDIFRKFLPVLGMKGLAASFTGSTEHRTLVVTDYFKKLLNRTPGPNEAEHIAGLPGDLLALEALVLSSDEFYNKG